MFPIALDRLFVIVVCAFAFLVVPFFINDYWEKSVLVPVLVWAMAALGLNILVGYCGLLSLGTGGFMAVGAYASYKFTTAFPELNMFVVILLAGGVTALVGVLFGLPSLRIKGFYLAVATLASQFFLVWLFNKVPWFYNYSASGMITAPEREVFGIIISGPNAPPWATYLFCLVIVVVFAVIAKNLTRGRIGRSWMAIRDMDIAAEIIGVPPLSTKLSAFAVSSFYIGISGALFFMVYLGAVEPTEAFGIDKSFLVLFMIIIGGLGSIFGSFFDSGPVQEYHGRWAWLAHRPCCSSYPYPDWWAYNVLLDCRTPWAGTAMADHEREASTLAVSSLGATNFHARCGH
jgi:branched-chain amino acid transport system permease protein